MKHHQSIQISIPKPCSEDWNKMTPQQQGRFCDSCQKCVVDFTGFTDAQLYQFFAEHKGQKVCGRVRNTQLNRHINIPPQPHSQLYKWIMAAGLALVFVAAPEGRVFAQAPLAGNAVVNVHSEEQKDTTNKENTFTIKGTVVDENNEPIINAVVAVFLGDTSKGATVTDFDGNFSIPFLSKNTYTLRTKYVGYKESWITKINLQNDLVLNVALEPPTLIYIDQTHTSGYIVPLMDKFGGGNTKTITSDEIEKGAY